MAATRLTQVAFECHCAALQASAVYNKHKEAINNQIDYLDTSNGFPAFAPLPRYTVSVARATLDIVAELHPNFHGDFERVDPIGCIEVSDDYLTPLVGLALCARDEKAYDSGYTCIEGGFDSVIWKNVPATPRVLVALRAEAERGLKQLKRLHPLDETNDAVVEALLLHIGIFEYDM